MQINLPPEVNSIIKTLSKAGHSSYAVGGCIRDSLMQIPPKDWDITTAALPNEIKKIFPHTVDTGIKHGTVTVLLANHPYEVTTYRIDGEYQDARRPEAVTFTDDIVKDLSRRDFTMNAIAYNPSTGLIDPYNGHQDIIQKNIRCVGHAPSRFGEDALRMMRAIRFSAQLSFNMDPETYQAISPLAERLALVSMERIREELTKILSSQNPFALLLLEETGLWPQILPKRDLQQAAKRLSKLQQKEPAMLYTFLLPDEAFMWHLKFDKRTIKETMLYSEWLNKEIIPDRYQVKKALSQMGQRQFENLLILKYVLKDDQNLNECRKLCRDIIESGECYSLPDLAINGGDLIAVGIAPGEAMGALIAKLLDKVMMEPGLNKKEILTKLAIRLVSPSRA